MEKTQSPWLRELARTRSVVSLSENMQSDIVVVGGGIAGVTTAYFLLKHTSKQIVLVEGNKVAHGATGHNAGQITSYFEKRLLDMIQEFGVERAIEAQRVVEEDARVLLDCLVKDIDAKTPYSQFIGYEGLLSLEEIESSCSEARVRREHGLRSWKTLIADTVVLPEHFEQEYRDLYTVVPLLDVGHALETSNSAYVAVRPFLSGCMNSAMFTEEVVGYMLATYSERFRLLEETHVETVSLEKDYAVLHALGMQIRCERVVLCTNGFEHFSIINNAGPDIDTAFHHLVKAKIGFMVGHVEPTGQAPTALIYNSTEPLDTDPDPYFYVTRRPYEKKSNEKNTLTCVGGPEYFLDEKKHYDSNMTYPLPIRHAIDEFMEKTLGIPKHSEGHSFYWHGVMGYTPNGMRRIGVEPCNPVLLYNLGCNGVGILPSIYGADRIAKILRGDTLPETVFDPADKRCAI